MPDRDAQLQARAVADRLRRLMLTMEQRRHHYGALAGVGDTDLMALANLHSDGPLSAADLAVRLGITRSSVTSLVDRLEKADLVARHGDPDDRRRLRIVLTRRGEEAVEKVRHWSLEALERIEPDRLSAVTEALDVLTDALQHHTAAAS